MKKKVKRSGDSKAKTRKSQVQKPAYSIFKDERIKFIIGLLITGFAVYLLFAFIAYLFWWKADQSLDPALVISSSDIVVKNWSGKSGAWFADLFIRQGFGLAAFFIPIIFSSIGLRMLNLKWIKAGVISRNMVLGTIIGSIALAYIFGSANGMLGSGPGGAHGLFISKWLNSFIGVLGTGILVSILLASYLIIAFKISPSSIKSFIGLNKHSDNDPGLDSENISGTATRVEGADNKIDDTRVSKENSDKDEIEFSIINTVNDNGNDSEEDKSDRKEKYY